MLILLNTEDLNDIILIIEFIHEAYSSTCKSRLHDDIRRFRYMTKKNIIDVETSIKTST